MAVLYTLPSLHFIQGTLHIASNDLMCIFSALLHRRCPVLGLRHALVCHQQLLLQRRQQQQVENPTQRHAASALQQVLSCPLVATVTPGDAGVRTSSSIQRPMGMGLCGSVPRVRIGSISRGWLRTALSLTWPRPAWSGKWSWWQCT